MMPATLCRVTFGAFDRDLESGASGSRRPEPGAPL